MRSKILLPVLVAVGLSLAGANAALAEKPKTNNGDVSALPEPGSVAVFAVGLLVAGGLIRHLRKP